MNSIEQTLLSMKTDPDFNPSDSFRKNARIRLLNSLPVENPGQRTRKMRGIMTMYSIRLAFFSIIIAAGSVLMSQTSRPGEPLFPVKVLSERIVLGLSPTARSKTSVANTIISRRIKDIEHAKKDGDKKEIDSSISSFKESITEIHKSTDIDTEKIEEEILGPLRQSEDGNGTILRKSEGETEIKGVETSAPQVTPTIRTASGHTDGSETRDSGGGNRETEIRLPTLTPKPTETKSGREADIDVPSEIESEH